MVATVKEVTVEVRANKTVIESPVVVELRDDGTVIDRIAFDAGALTQGTTIRRIVRFPNAPEDGWTVQPGAVCTASPGLVIAFSMRSRYTRVRMR